MSTFDLKKFLTENKLTRVSKLLKEENTPGFDKFADAVEDVIPSSDPQHDKLLDAVHQALVDGEIGGNPNEPGSYYREVLRLAKELGMIDENFEEDEEFDDSPQFDLKSPLYGKPDIDPEIAEREVAELFAEEDPMYLAMGGDLVLDEIIEIMESLGFSIPEGMYSKEMLKDFHSMMGNIRMMDPSEAAKKAVAMVLDPQNYVPKMKKEEVSGEEEMQPQQEGQQDSDVSKYLALESPDDIIKEIEKDITKTTFEAKLSKLREVISAIDQKVTSLEEDISLSGFVNTSKIKEMKRTAKKLRSIEEKYSKEYDKKFNKK